MNRLSYPTDLSAGEWIILEPQFPVSPYGRDELHTTREILNAIYYQARSGCAWRLLPHDLPPWTAVYSRFRRWVAAGTWERANAALRTQVREAAGREAEPTAGILDAQSVRTGGNRGGCHGHDAGKQTSGRKRHILVDVLGLLLVLHVQAADVQDRLGAKQVLESLARTVPTVRKVWADGGYSGPLVKGYAAAVPCEVEIVSRPPDAKGFVLLKKRWVVERTFGWLGKYRRLAGRDFETNPRNSEGWIYVCMTNLMVRRLAKVSISRRVDVI